MDLILAELRALAVDPWVRLFLVGATALAVVGAMTTSPAFLSGLLLAVCAAVITSRDLYEGTVADSLTRTPDRTRLLLARVAAPAVLTAAATATLTVATWGIGSSMSAAATEGPAVVLLTVQAVCLGLVTRRPAITVPVVLVWWFVAPTALRALGVYLGAADALVWLSPVGLAADAAGWPPVPARDAPAWSEAVRGAAALIAWTVALLAAARTWLERRDFGPKSAVQQLL